MSPDFSTRSSQSEWMEQPDLDASTLEKSLDDLARINTVLRGYAPSFHGIETLIGARNTELSILDVGTGSGDFPRRVEKWASRRNLDVRITGVDVSEETVDYAERKTGHSDVIDFETVDLFDLDGDRKWDVVHAALMLHHLPGQRAVEGLRRMWESCRLGVVINDLHRHPVGYYGCRVLLRLVSDNEITRHDGAVSFLRAFRRRDLQRIAAEAEVADPDIRWWPLFRWQMIVPGPCR